MEVHFPVKAVTGDNSVGIVDSRGFWVSFGKGTLEIPGNKIKLGNQIASMINSAYEQGRAEAKQEIRDALGIQDRED